MWFQRIGLFLFPFALAGAVALLLVMLAWRPAFSMGWYDYACCSDRDCGPLPDGEVSATSVGWRIQSTGEVVPYGQERASQDNRFHRCAPKANQTKCLYVPPAGS